MVSLLGGLTDEPTHDIRPLADYDGAVNSTPELARLGTRASLLARTQSEWVRARLESPALRLSVVPIESTGDGNWKHPLFAVSPESPGLFTRELEDALLAGTIDLAVHSLKDLPTRQPPGLVVRAIPTRESSRDVLCIRPDRIDRSQPVLPLAAGATVGTSSLRREAALLAARPDLKIVSIRGNVPTRLDKARQASVDAVVLAEAGLRRLGAVSHRLAEGLELHPLDESVFVPAPAQGALAVQTRDAVAPALAAALAAIHDDVAAEEVRWERFVLRGAEGGCTLPLGVRCRRDGDAWTIDAFLGLLEAPARPNEPRRWMSFHHVHDRDRSPDAVAQRVVERLCRLKELQPWTGAKTP